MERLQLIQQLIDSRKFKSYLEIGVLGGNNFFPIKCSKKIAVDPDFRFNWRGRLGETLKNSSNIKASFFETTSDIFFEKHAPQLFREAKIDIALIDGMHEFEFALRDVLNCLKYLSNNGVIILHDCNPQTKDAACSFNEWKDRGFTGFWNGDVWKCITYLKDNRPDVNVFVADCDHGLGVVTKSKREIVHPEFNSIEKVKTLTYQDFNSRRKEMINLQSVSFLEDFIKRG